jgi:SHS family lactate transporter-like MFS transporter
MPTSVRAGRHIAWWQEPTREQWHAWVAAWLGWTLSSFDFTIFVFIMLPIARSSMSALTAVTARSLR